MTMHAATALEKAIVRHLRNDATLTGLLNGPKIYDHAPRREETPYITVGDIETTAWDTFRARGHQHRLTLHVWTDHRGRREAFGILHRLDELLDEAALTLDGGHHLVSLRTTFWTALPDPNGRHVRGLIRLRAITHIV